MDVEKTIEELKTATGWQHISFKSGYFVIQMTMKDMRVIKGLKRANECLYLDFPSFSQLPLCFLVGVSGIVHQYWTRNGMLHRTGGRPSYVSFDPDNERIIRRWHWNGVLHRTDGPAKEMIKKFAIEDATGFEGFQLETWDYMSLEWYHEGFPAKFPWITKVEMENGRRLRDCKTHNIHSPREDIAAFVTEKANFEWHVTQDPGDFRPLEAEFLDLNERYDQGAFVDRSCSMADFTWKRGSTTLDHKDVTRFNEELKDGELLPMLDLWGQFYADAATEVLLLTEFGRIGKDGE